MWQHFNFFHKAFHYFFKILNKNLKSVYMNLLLPSRDMTEKLYSDVNPKNMLCVIDKEAYFFVCVLTYSQRTRSQYLRKVVILKVS